MGNGAVFELELRGVIEVKNKGALNMHFLNRLKPEFSRDPEGCLARAPVRSPT